MADLVGTVLARSGTVLARSEAEAEAELVTGLAGTVGCAASGAHGFGCAWLRRQRSSRFRLCVTGLAGTVGCLVAGNPARYLNIYTNTASGARGFNVIPPWLDGGTLVGSAEDRIVVNHLVFGRDAAFPPHDQGRTATHEVGHYLGLMHPYFGGCGLPGVPDCYSTDDLICDTPPDAQSHDKCPVGALSCGGFAVPIENYMELTDDFCMTGFTAEQVQRMRCTLLTYRQDLLEAGAIFGDGFESGDLSVWS